jgi:hypothetical protein
LGAEDNKDNASTEEWGQFLKKQATYYNGKDLEIQSIMSISAYYFEAMLIAVTEIAKKLDFTKKFRVVLSHDPESRKNIKIEFFSCDKDTTASL